MAVTTTNNKPLNPRGNDQSPKGYNRAELYSGKALDFDGVNDYVDCGTLDVTGYTEISISLYVNIDTIADSRIVSLKHTGGDDLRIFTASGSGNKILFALDDTTPVTIETPIETNRWFHIVMTHDGTTLKAYTNGQESVSAASNFNYSSADGKLWLGRYTDGTLYYNGQMSGFKIFNTALTAAQVADLYNNPEKVVPTGVADSALKLWLPMQEGAGTTAINGAPDALGSEEVTNGNFATDSDWTKGTGWTISGGLASSDGSQGGTSGLTSSTISGLNNKGSLLLEVIVDSVTAGTLYATLQGTGGLDIINISSAGTYKVLCETTDVNAQITLGASVDFVGSVSLVSLKELQNCGAISGATWTHGIGAPVAQTSVIDWNKGDYLNDGGTITEILIPQGLTSGRDLLGNLFENVRKQGALNLDGNSRASVHENASIDLSDCSLEAWVCPLPESGSGWQTIFSKVSQANLQIYLNAADVLAHYNTVTAGGVLYGTAFNKNEWHHIVCVEDGTDVLTYVDGILRTTKTISLQMDSDGAFSIGSKPGILADEITAQIAQPRIYNRALTAEEVERNYTAGKYTYTND